MKCFYHNDIDGRSSASVVAKYFDNYNREDFYEVDYVQELNIDNIVKDELIVFVDYSFKENTIHYIDKIMETTKNIIWIDHHKSSIDLLKKRPDLQSIKGVREENISGCALTYMYFYDKDNIEDCPLWVQYVSDYDCWIYKFGQTTTEFKLGIESIPHDFNDKIWKELIHETLSDFDKLSHEEAVKYIINKGKIIYSYIQTQNDYLINLLGYESEILGEKCYVINDKNNSWVFGEKVKEYKYCIVYAFNGEKYVYSVFSDPIHKDAQCNKIAEHFGGGGHKGAAGFTSDELILKKIK